MATLFPGPSAGFLGQKHGLQGSSHHRLRQLFSAGGDFDIRQYLGHLAVTARGWGLPLASSR